MILDTKVEEYAIIKRRMKAVTDLNKTYTHKKSLFLLKTLFLKNLSIQEFQTCTLANVRCVH